MLTYMEVHLYYTLPVLGLLFMILRPFHSSQDTLKYVFLSTIAFLTASPWDNYIVYHRAWWYCPSCVTAVIGHVPLEEYMFFIIMSLMTVAFTNLVMRWRLPSVFVKPDAPIVRSMIIRYVPIAFLLSIAVRAWSMAIPDTRFFYGACILWYVCPVLALLWFGAGEYICRRWQTVLVSIVVPTLYLCWVDQVAIAAGTWHISLRTSTGIHVAPNLPLEEFAFWLLINVILVFATCAIDRAHAIMHLCGGHQGGSQSLVTKMVNLTWAFCLSDQQLSRKPFQDSEVTWSILRKASYSFYTASAVFPVNVRQDLGVLYGFCRATDDLADDEAVPVSKRREQLDVVRDLVRELFSAKRKANVDWMSYRNQLPDSCIASMRAFARLRPVLEVDAVNELLDGYEFDLTGQQVKHEKDLEYYSACVASSVGELCTRVIMQGYSNHWVIKRARDMGLVLQYTNIARDIVTDSQQLGRCYLPRTWITDNEYELIVSGGARKLGDARLRQLALRLVNMAKELGDHAERGIDRLPQDCQGGVRAACAVYSAIGDELIKANGYPTRAHVSTLKRAWIVLKSVYDIKTPSSLYSSSDSSFLVNKLRKGKVRAFMID
ncbi:lycopene cyclase phytoene synthase [Lichtheimia corymbifera JMRC:FSU:9682]|uniref:Bifunctional lycopene cyclase/phytoene synthase n=1 Tax=Lichtheimia corymbifera JMRC:FSU:9682 TaxID=1263082 RepID=A0A068RST9_9FUNG|nr:lycopene cyclase phytoene synthase [Lichtheimia corymbifera JMRC:FSU:9682]